MLLVELGNLARGNKSSGQVRSAHPTPIVMAAVMLNLAYSEGSIADWQVIGTGNSRKVNCKSSALNCGGRGVLNSGQSSPSKLN